MSKNLETALRVHEFMLTHFWAGNKLIGPDAGVRLNLRFVRFVRSYLPWIAWNDRYYYLQTQGYWVLGNWRLFQATGSPAYREIALACSDSIVATQREDGSWEYPHPEWKGRIATAEGTWASIGLVQSYELTRDERYLECALRWYRFLISRTGYIRHGDELAVNYFAEVHRPRIPNNSAFVARFYAELAHATGDVEYLRDCPGLIRFLANAQRSNGELPYGVAESSSHPVRPHYQCFQYNAFQCLDLMRYHELTPDRLAEQVIGGLLDWLTTGVAADGQVRFDCSRNPSRITYHTTVVAAAFETASALQIGDYSEWAERCFTYIRGIQYHDGSFGFSEADYGLLNDRRAYPRCLSMMIYHLLTGDVMARSAHRSD